jgi:hypothetical protein
MAFEWPESMQLQTKQRVASILWTLQQNGGEVTEESGLVTALLNDLCRAARVRVIPNQSPGTYASLISNMCGERQGSPWANDALIERDVKGKRTFAIRLLLEDQEMPEPTLAWAPSFMPVGVAETLGLVPTGSAAETVDVGPVEVDEPEVVIETEPSGGEDAEVIEDVPEVTTEPAPVAVRAETPAALRKVLAISKLATDLMIELSEIERRHSDESVLERLAETLAENQRLAETNRELRSLVEAKANEIAALRHSLKLTGANLERLRLAVSTNGSGHFEVDGQRELARLMQAPPANH